MSLLDTASLIVTPNGYKEGKLYSVIPSDGSGDLSVTRATTATRVNSQGLVELVPYNFVQYSEQFDQSYWIKYNTSVTANQTTAPDGTLTADKVTLTGGFGSVYVSTIDFNGITTISCYFKKGNNTKFYIEGNPTSGYFGAGFNLDTEVITPFGVATSFNIENLNNGWYRCSVSATASGSGYVAYGIQEPSAGQFGYYWGAQVNEGTIKPYQKTETRLNIPRLDYSNGTCPSILVEPQRTNLVTYSENFNSSNGYNYQNASFSSSSIVSPSGLTAKGITSTTSSNDFHRFYKSLGGLTGTYTTTIYGKKGTSRYLGLGINQNGSTGNNNVVVFDLQDGVIASNIYGVTASIQDVGDGWYRCEHTFNYGTGGTYADICVHNTGTGAFTINAFQTFDSPTAPTTLYIYGLQLEAGSYATSYIPTTNSSVTRNADVISKTGISSLIGQTEGTIFIDLDFTDASISMLLQLFDGASDVMAIYTGSNSVFFDGSNGSAQWSISGSLPNGHHKLALAYKANDIAVYIDGTLIGTDTSAAVPTTDQLYLNANVYQSFIEKQRFNAVALWKTRLTNTQLAQLTTI